MELVEGYCEVKTGAGYKGGDVSYMCLVYVMFLFFPSSVRALVVQLLQVLILSNIRFSIASVPLHGRIRDAPRFARSIKSR